MSKDDASAEPRSEQDHSAAKTDDQKHGSGRRVGGILKKFLKGWRALAFLLIVLVTGSYAFHYRALSNPGAENRRLANHAPQQIDFFVSNPNVSIYVNVSVGPRLPESSSAQDVVNVTMTVHAPSRVKTVNVLMLSNTSPEPGESEPNETPPSRALIFSPFSNLKNSPPAMGTSPEPQIIDRRFATVVSGAPDELSSDTFDYYIGNDVEQTNAYLYGHLPAIGSMDQSAGSDPSAPPVLEESYKNPPYRTRDIVLDPWIYNSYFRSTFFSPTFNFSTLKNPKSYRTPYGGPGGLFYSPARLSITEAQQDLAPTIASQQINYMTPTGQPSGQDYVWRGSTYLEPVFQTTNDGALQSESSDAFLSGILFGIAGAAAIALVQEIPEAFSQPAWWSRRKRKRGSSSLAATDETPDSAEAGGQEVDTKRISKPARSSGLGWPPSS